jgi:cell division protein FtsQ
MSAWMRTAFITLPLAIVVVALSAVVVWSRHPDRFPIRVIEVCTELRHIPQTEIQTVLSPFLNKGFFWLNVEQMQALVQAMPWVQSVDLRRVWPDRVRVSAQERVAQARWGERGVVSTEGVIFYPDPATISEKLPWFEGPVESAKEMLSHYLTALELLGPMALNIQGLRLSPTGSWHMQLENGIELILGKVDFSERLMRLMVAYQNSLQAQSTRIAYIDLRYTNGFAIGWKAGIQ